MILILNPPSRYSRNLVKDVAYGCWCKGKRIAGAQVPNLTMLNLATILRDIAPTSYFDASLSDYDHSSFIKYLAKFDTIIIPLSLASFPEDKELINEVHQVNQNTVFIAYGPLATFSPRVVLKKSRINLCVLGEPEFTLRTLFRKIYEKRSGEIFRKKQGSKKKGYAIKPDIFQNDQIFSSISSIAYKRYQNKRDQDIIVQPQKVPTHDLDEIPIADRTYIEDTYFFHPLVKNKKWTTMQTSRGCIGNCVFCSSPSFYKDSLRLQSLERILEEIKELKSMGYQEIMFRDENFCVSQQRVKKFCLQLITQSINLDWMCNSRPDSLTKPLVQLMKRAGCHTIKFGVESGSQRMLNNYKKNILVSQIKKSFEWCHQAGIRTHAHLIIGGIGENKQTLKKTEEILKEIKPTTITVNILMFLPGSPLFCTLEKSFPVSQLYNTITFKNMHETGQFLSFVNDLDPEYIEYYQKKLYRDYYLNLSYILNQLKNIRGFFDIGRLLKSAINVLDFAGF